MITLTLLRWADSCLSPPPSENIFVYFLFDTYRLTITCEAIYRLTILLDYPLLDRAVVALVLIFAYLLCTSSESTPGREREEADLIWREVKFPEYRNSISGHFHVKRAALISICRKGVLAVAAIEYEPD